MTDVKNVLESRPNFPVGSNTETRMRSLQSQLDCKQKIMMVKDIRAWYGVGLKEAKYAADDVFDSTSKESVKLIRQLASGGGAVTDLRKGINACFRNWETLGYNNVQDAILDFMHRSR